MSHDWTVFRFLEEYGLACVWSLELLPPMDPESWSQGLWALVPNPLVDDPLPRECMRPWLHLSIAFDGEVEPELLERIRLKWEGRLHQLRGRRGGSCFFVDPDDPVGRCPLIKEAHDKGWYSDRELHISM